MSENEFLARIKAHQGIIYKLVHLYAQSEEDKKDFYQEILLQAWKSYGSFRREAAFSTWLYRLALNTIFTLNRQSGKQTFADPLAFANSITISPDEEAERLYKAIRTLAETERAIVSLHLDGYGNSEISDMLGISANAVGVKLHRAKLQLANLLKNT